MQNTTKHHHAPSAVSDPTKLPPHKRRRFGQSLAMNISLPQGPLRSIAQSGTFMSMPFIYSLPTQHAMLDIAVLWDLLPGGHINELLRRTYSCSLCCCKISLMALASVSDVLLKENPLTIPPSWRHHLCVPSGSTQLAQAADIRTAT